MGHLPKAALSRAASAKSRHACPSAHPMHAPVSLPSIVSTDEPAGSDAGQRPPGSELNRPGGEITTPPLPSAPKAAEHSQPSGPKSRMRPRSSVYTATFPTNDVGIVTSIDVGKCPVVGLVTAFSVGQLTVGALTALVRAAACVLAVAECCVVAGGFGPVVLHAAVEATTMQSPARSPGLLAPASDHRRSSEILTSEHDIGGPGPPGRAVP